MVDMFVRRLDEVLERPQILVDLAYGTLNCADKFKWDHRLKTFREVYTAAADNWNSKQRKNFNRKTSFS